MMFKLILFPPGLGFVCNRRVCDCLAALTCDNDFIRMTRYRVAEIRYHRVSSMKSRIENVLLFVPDVWSCVPTASQWETIVQSYIQPPNEPVEADPEAKASQTNISQLWFFHKYL